MRHYFVYILTNQANTVLYIGVTNNLARRLYEHKEKKADGFTARYRVYKLVYFEQTDTVVSALQREKQLKNWHRQWKINLIKQTNPFWEDLSGQVGATW